MRVLDSSFPNLTPKPHVQPTEHLASQIYTVDTLFTAAELSALRSWAQNITLDPPKPPGRGEAERTAFRTSFDSPSIATHLLSFLAPQIEALTPRLRSPPLLSPNIRVYHYPPKTFFGPHYDSPTMDSRTRRLSCWTVLVYLTDGVEGGETVFYLDKEKEKERGRRKKEPQGERIAIAPQAGRVLFHWHGVAGGGCLRHEGREVTKGDKWVLRTDVLA
ncbi:hypothetical protein P7C73_g914, partial [Tremellales sp. Uapishka_1]